MKKLKTFAKTFWNDESGQGTAEYVLLVAIVVALVIMFKTPIMNAMKAQIDKVTGNISNFDAAP